MRRIRSVRVLARVELLDGFRNRRQVVVRAATPLLLLSVLVAIGTLSGGGSAATDDLRYTIAVEGDRTGAGELLAAIASFDDERFDLIDTNNAALAVVGPADAALVLPAGADSADPLALTIVSNVTNRPSRTAAIALRAAIVADNVDLPPNVTVVFEDATDQEIVAAGEDLQTALAQVAAALVLIQGAGMLGSGAARMAGRRSTGTLASQLVWSVDRTDLVTSRGLAELTLGLVASVPLLALVGLVTTVGLIAAGASQWVLPGLAALLVGTLLVSLPLVAGGMFIGVVARSPQQVSAAAAGGFVLAVVAIQLTTVGSSGIWLPATVLPLIGPANAVRLTIEGTAAPLEILLATAGSVITAAGLLVAAGRGLNRERVALRS